MVTFKSSISGLHMTKIPLLTLFFALLSLAILDAQPVARIDKSLLLGEWTIASAYGKEPKERVDWTLKEDGSMVDSSSKDFDLKWYIGRIEPFGDVLCIDNGFGSDLQVFVVSRTDGRLSLKEFRRPDTKIPLELRKDASLILKRKD